MHVLINPEYTGVQADDAKETKVSDMEGCYSVGSVCGHVPRFHTIQVTYQTTTGASIAQTVSGFYARVLQHEIDHLNGILILDHLLPENRIKNAKNPAPKEMLASNWP